MKRRTPQHLVHVRLTVLLTALAACVTTSPAQVTFQQITNGLIDYYPLTTINPGGMTTPDLVSRRDMVLINMTSNNIVSDTHPGILSNYVFNFTQSGGATLVVYQSIGQDPLDGSGDFLPFINQRGATMNFWIKGPVPAAQDLRVMAECADNGDNQPFFSLSDQPSTRLGLGTFLRLNVVTNDPNGISVNQLPDGTYQLPAYYYEWTQSTLYTTNTIFDNNWHMFTMEIASNGDVHVFVDGSYDPGNQSASSLDHEGNPAITPPLDVTNLYYTTNNYPLVNPATNNPPPNGYVRWMIPGLNQAGAFTAFGGFDRNGGTGSGPAIKLSDIAFWNRILTTNEIRFLTNGFGAVPINTNVMTINAFYADMGEVARNGMIGLHWSLQNATNVSITGVGSNLAASGDATVTVSANQTYTFTLTAQNGYVAPIQRSMSVQVLPGVANDWNLIQRFDGLYAPTTQGIQDYPGDTQINPLGGTWKSIVANWVGNLDRFNVVTMNGNKMLSPRSGYYIESTNIVPFGYDSRGAIALGFLNGLSIHPYKSHTLFFRFAVRNPGSLAANYNIYSGLDFAFGLTDFNFGIGPLGGGNPPYVGTVGPGFKIISCDTTGALQLKPFDLVAADYTGSNYLAGYDYMTDAVNGNPGGLLTNVTYMAWLDVSNDNTHRAIDGSVVYTANEPKFGLWLQRQGGAQVQLFSGYGGNRDWALDSSSDSPLNILNKLFVSVCTEDLVNGDWACFLETNNMIVLDDFYLSKTGYDHSLPRPLAIQSIVRGSTNATVTWYSFGSLFQTNTYSVQRKANLTDPTWTTLTNGLPSGGDFTGYTDQTAGSSGTAFYRIVWP